MGEWSRNRAPRIILLPDYKPTLWASLVAQWLRVCLLMQGTRVRALVWEDPTCRGVAGPVGHDCWACASGACALQQERPRWWGTRALRWGVAPACRNWREPSHRNEDPTQPEINKKLIKKKKKNLHCDSCYQIRRQYPEGIWMVGSRAILAWVQVPALPLTLWLTLGKLPYLPMSQCPLICT